MFLYDGLQDNDLQKLAAEGDSNAEEELVSRYMRLVRVCARPLFLAGGYFESMLTKDKYNCSVYFLFSLARTCSSGDF